MRVLGYVMAKNEWPLLGLSITHALRAGLDHIVVVDHASSDLTSVGLQSLVARWPDQLTVFRLEDDAYFQEATTSMVMAAVGASRFDWVYVFDADEFVLASPETSLHHELQRLPAGVDVVRYEIQQWLTPENMDDTNPTDFGRAVKRTVPNIFTNPNGLLNAEDIEAGLTNFFDYPFPSKVIVRGGLTSNLSAGAHSVNSRSRVIEVSIEPTRLRVGHLPLLSWARLLRKSEHGQSLVDAGFGQEHGWQNQLIRRLELNGSLLEFWTAHSDSKSNSGSPVGRPTTVVDLALAEALAGPISEFSSVLDTPKAPRNSSLTRETTVALGEAVRVQHDQIKRHQFATAERDHLATQLTHTTTERDHLATQLSEVTDAVDHLRREVEALRRSRAYRLGRMVLRPVALTTKAFRTSP